MLDSPWYISVPYTFPEAQDAGHTTFSAPNVEMNKSIVDSQVPNIKLASFLVSQGRPEMWESAYPMVVIEPAVKTKTSLPLIGSNDSPSSSLNVLANSVKSVVPSNEKYLPEQPPLKHAESTPSKMEYFLSIVYL